MMQVYYAKLPVDVADRTVFLLEPIIRMLIFLLWRRYYNVIITSLL